jgi:predicted ATPase/DNA-binding SARP family transcriptional activator
MELGLLGPLEVRSGQDIIRIRPGNPRKLLVILALRVGERISSDALIDAIWGEGAQSDRVNALQVLVSYLRKALASSRDGTRIETVDGGYRLVAAREAVDAYRLESAVVGTSGIGDPAERLATLEAALQLWRGSPIPEVANEDFAQADLHRLNELRLAALELRLDASLELGRHREAVAELSQLVVVHPLRERFYVQLMTALYRSGRQAEALSIYDRARTTLVEELGLDPGPELQAAAQSVLTQSMELSTQKRPEELAPSAASGQPPGSGSISALPDAARPLEPLIGRQEELARLLDLLRERRFITLLGPGGAGKTRLAAEVAAESSRQVWWVDLSGLTAEPAMRGAVAAATGAPTRPDDDGSLVVARLAGEDGILVLDTCERLRDELRPLVEAILRSCPGVSLLATSRKPIGARTELTWPVPPLSLPDPQSGSLSEIAASAAVQLFVARAANRAPGFGLTSANCLDVARICLLLDGLPLAIELAAAHAGMLDPSTMVRVLDDRLRLLVDESRADRQYALRATIAWSYDVLDPEEAVFFQRLAVFAGAFPLEAAIAVAAEGLARDGMQLLLALAQQSLVAVEGNGRFRLLDTIRAFATEHLARREPDHTDAQRRHAVWFADMLTGAGSRQGSPVEGWRGELRDALPDLRAALAWCFSSGEDELGVRLLAALWWLWPREGVFDEAAQWFPRAKELVPAGSALQAELLSSSGTYALSRGDLATAAADCGTAAALFDHLGYRRSLAQALIGLGIAHWGQGEYLRAGEAHDRAAGIFAELRDAWGVGLTLVLRARTAIDAGSADAEQRLDAAEAAARSCRDGHVLAAALVYRARAEIAAGEFAEAVEHARESLRLNETHGHREGAVGSLHALGLALIGQGRPETAADPLDRALRAAVAMHHAGAAAESLDCLAVLASEQGRWFDAARSSSSASELRSRTGIARSRLVAGLIGRVESGIVDHLQPAELAEAQREGITADVMRLAPQ